MRLSESVWNCNVPCHRLPSGPWYQRRSIWAFAITSEKTSRFLGCWYLCSFDSSPYDVIRLTVSLLSAWEHCYTFGRFAQIFKLQRIRVRCGQIHVPQPRSSREVRVMEWALVRVVWSSSITLLTTLTSCETDRQTDGPTDIINASVYGHDFSRFLTIITIVIAGGVDLFDSSLRWRLKTRPILHSFHEYTINFTLMSRRVISGYSERYGYTGNVKIR